MGEGTISCKATRELYGFGEGMIMDFNSIKSVIFKVFDDTTVVRLKHPVTGELLEDEQGFAEIEIFNKNSSIARHYLQNIKSKLLIGRDNRSVVQQNTEFFKTITKSVRNINLGDEKITKDTSHKLYGDTSLYWVVEQISVAFGFTST